MKAHQFPSGLFNKQKYLDATSGNYGLVADPLLQIQIFLWMEYRFWACFMFFTGAGLQSKCVRAELQKEYTKSPYPGRLDHIFLLVHRHTTPSEVRVCGIDYNKNGLNTLLIRIEAGTLLAWCFKRLSRK